jgi:hypothetical protein
VVRGGRARKANDMSSMPTIETSSGIFTPASSSALIAPMAMRSLPQKITVGISSTERMVRTDLPRSVGCKFSVGQLQFALQSPILADTVAGKPSGVTSTSGAVMPPSGGPKKIPWNTPINLAPITAETGPIIGDWPSDKMKNGYTLTGNFTVEQQLPGDMALQMSFVTNNGIDLYQSSYPNAYTGAQPQNTPFTNITPGLAKCRSFITTPSLITMRCRRRRRRGRYHHCMAWHIRSTIPGAKI